MDWEEIEALQKQGQENILRASHDIGFARKMAKQTYHGEKTEIVLSKTHGTEIWRLWKALDDLSDVSKEHLRRAAESIGDEVSLATLKRTSYEAAEWLKDAGRKKTPIVGAVSWLSYWWVGQGNPISNTLRNSKSKKLGNTPSKMLKFMHDELEKIDPKIPIETVHNTLRKKTVADEIRRFAVEFADLQK